MSCVINYNNKTYSLEDFKNVLLQEPSLLKEVTNKSQEKLKAIQEIFNQNPELSKIGDVFSYAIYLDTIFPDSKVKDIKQHTTESDFDNFTKEGSGRLGKGYYFSDFGNDYIEGENVKKKLVLLNVKNPLNIQGGQFMKDVYKLLDDRNQSSDDVDAKIIAQRDINNQYKSKSDALIGDKNGVLNSEIKVFEPEQIHILSSKADIEGFKNYVAFENSEFAKYGTYQQFQEYITNKSSMEIENRLIETGKIDRVC